MYAIKVLKDGDAEAKWNAENEWQQNKPSPLVDEKLYDIILDGTGERINGVEYWSFGGGFLARKTRTELKYLLPDVKFYRLHKPTVSA